MVAKRKSTKKYRGGEDIQPSEENQNLFNDVNSMIDSKGDIVSELHKQAGGAKKTKGGYNLTPFVAALTLLGVNVLSKGNVSKLTYKQFADKAKNVLQFKSMKGGINTMRSMHRGGNGTMLEDAMKTLSTQEVPVHHPAATVGGKKSKSRKYRGGNEGEVNSTAVPLPVDVVPLQPTVGGKK